MPNTQTFPRQSGKSGDELTDEELEDYRRSLSLPQRYRLAKESADQYIIQGIRNVEENFLRSGKFPAFLWVAVGVAVGPLGWVLMGAAKVTWIAHNRFASMQKAVDKNKKQLLRDSYDGKLDRDGGGFQVNGAANYVWDRLRQSRQSRNGDTLEQPTVGNGSSPVVRPSWDPSNQVALAAQKLNGPDGAELAAVLGRAAGVEGERVAKMITGTEVNGVPKHMQVQIASALNMLHEHAKLNGHDREYGIHPDSYGSSTTEARTLADAIWSINAVRVASGDPEISQVPDSLVGSEEALGDVYEKVSYKYELRAKSRSGQREAAHAQSTRSPSTFTIPPIFSRPTSPGLGLTP